MADAPVDQVVLIRIKDLAIVLSRKTAHSSEAWNFFGKLKYKNETLNSNRFYCNVCLETAKKTNKEQTFSSANVTSFGDKCSTTNMIGHLRNDHQIAPQKSSPGSNALTDYYSTTGRKSLPAAQKSLVFHRDIVLWFAKDLRPFNDICKVGITIFLLQSNPTSRSVCAVFRVQLYLLSGTTLALAFPVVSTRFLPFEDVIYFVQHWLIFIIPLYLMWIGGAYTADSLSDFSWSLLSLAILLLYHFIPLRTLAMLTSINLNSTLCPAASDPYPTQHYRLLAIIHQSFFVIAPEKLYVYLANHILRFARHVLETRFGYRYPPLGAGVNSDGSPARNGAVAKDRQD